MLYEMMTTNMRSLVDKNQDMGHEFSSATSYYRKLVNDSFMPFSYWNEMCRRGQLVRTQQKQGHVVAHYRHSEQNQLKTLNFSINS